MSRETESLRHSLLEKMMKLNEATVDALATLRADVNDLTRRVRDLESKRDRLRDELRAALKEAIDLATYGPCCCLPNCKTEECRRLAELQRLVTP